LGSGARAQGADVSLARLRAGAPARDQLLEHQPARSLAGFAGPGRIPRAGRGPGLPVTPEGGPGGLRDRWRLASGLRLSQAGGRAAPSGPLVAPFRGGALARRRSPRGPRAVALPALPGPPDPPLRRRALRERDGPALSLLEWSRDRGADPH